MKNIIIIGSRGYLYHYGGWETFVTNLVKNTKEKEIQYYIPNLTNEKKDDQTIKKMDQVISPQIYVPKQGFVTMFTFTIRSMKFFLKYIKKEKIESPIIIMLGCKVGPFFPFWHPKIKKQNGKLIINPDGLEWKRDKWSWWIKICFKISEYFSIKWSDYCICDSKVILDYVQKKYNKTDKVTKFIAYGADENINPNKTKELTKVFQKYNLKEKEYFLIVGRFVPENNYEMILKEFMKTSTKKDLVIVSNVEEDKFYKHLKETCHFDEDKRIKFIGTIYDKDSLAYVRKNAYAYIHGHSVGGTNPSLLEALSITDINLLFDVDYNREVGEDACLYFQKEEDSLKKLIEKVEKLTMKEKEEYSQKAKKRIKENYNWPLIVQKYNEVYNELLNK